MGKLAAAVALASLAGIGAAAMAQQMGGPNAPTKIPDALIDPARNLTSATLESARHKALPEQYIWTKSDSVPVGSHTSVSWDAGSNKNLGPHYFRRTFQVSTIPVQATLYVAGPRKAEMYLNGKEVGRFELNLDFRLGTHVYRVDAVDVTHALRTGNNVLAIQALRGPHAHRLSLSRLGEQQTLGEVLAAMIVPAARGIQAAPLVMSDAKWKATTDPQQPGWDQPGFNDSTWPAVEDIGGIESSMAFYQGNSDAGMYAWPGYDGISPFLAHYSMTAASVEHVYAGVGTVQNPQSLTAGANGADLVVTLPRKHVAEYQAPQVTLDFGREVNGRLELVSDSGQPAEVTVQYGESRAEAVLQPYLGVDPIYLPAHGTAYGPKSAFRYAVIRFIGGRDTRFHAIRLDGIAYPVNYGGSFESSDAELNTMWAIGAYTAHLCMQDDIWDAPKRDRERYAGDLDVTGRTIDDVFLDRFLMAGTLDRLLGPAPIRLHVDTIPGYSALWVADEKQFYLHTGDRKQLGSVHTRLVQLLDYMKTDLNDQNLFSDRSKAWVFADWSPGMSGYGPQTRMVTQFEYYAAFRDGAWLLRALGDEQNADRMEKQAEMLKAAAQRLMLDKQGSFGSRWQPNAYAVLSGVAGPGQYAAIWRNSLEQVGHSPNPYTITPYYNFYVISAMARMGRRQAALDWIRQYWGGMVKEGATSFWEGYMPDWPNGFLFHESLQADGMSGYFTSLAHGWSSGVTPWLMRQVLGIEPTAGGFAKVNIRPDLIDLAWARGSEPTPHGLLSVSITKSEGYTTTVTLPSDVEASVSVPVSSPGAHVLVNGKQQASTAAEGGKRAVVVLSGQGTYVVTTAE